MTSSQKLYENNFHLNVGHNMLKLQPNVPTGAYIVNVQIGNKVLSYKIIKD
jgi:hypothetical protein